MPSDESRKTTSLLGFAVSARSTRHTSVPGKIPRRGDLLGVVLVLPLAPGVAGPARRGEPASPSAGRRVSVDDSRGGAPGGPQPAGHAAYTEAQFCHPPAGRRGRYPQRPGFARARGRGDHADLYARHEPARAGAQEPAGRSGRRLRVEAGDSGFAFSRLETQVQLPICKRWAIPFKYRGVSCRSRRAIISSRRVSIRSANGLRPASLSLGIPFPPGADSLAAWRHSGRHRLTRSNPT